MSTPSLSVPILGYGYACFNPASNMLSIKVLLFPPACSTHLIISILGTAVLYFGKIKPCVEVFFRVSLSVSQAGCVHVYYRSYLILCHYCKEICPETTCTEATTCSTSITSHTHTHTPSTCHEEQQQTSCSQDDPSLQCLKLSNMELICSGFQLELDN